MIATHRMPLRRRMPLAAIALALLLPAALPTAVEAQQKDKPKKLYCWNENGRKVCSDSLPASAVGHERTERNTSTGTTLSSVNRALSADERVRAAAEAEAKKAEEDRARREMAMVVSYQTEQDLERAFRNRFELIEESLKGSEMALVNLHKSLVSLLRQANELELQSKPVGKALRTKIATQHAELLALRALKQRQLAERAALDAEFQQALSRYRALKQAQDVASAAMTPAPATGQ
jgi:hypothetical protein